MNATTLIVNAIEAGVTSSLTDEQRGLYNRLIECASRELSAFEEASFALKRMLNKPGSVGARYTLMEELNSIDAEEYAETKELSKSFLEIVQQQIATQYGLYNIARNVNIGGDFIIGYNQGDNTSFSGNINDG